MANMSDSFHAQIRAAVQRNWGSGKLQTELLEIRRHIVADIPTEQPVKGEGETVHQRRLELAYLDGYLEGPAVDIIDHKSVEERAARRRVRHH